MPDEPLPEPDPFATNYEPKDPDGTNYAPKDSDATNWKPAPEEPRDGLPRGFGAYELLKEVGRGGMGRVYLARQSIGGRVRLVALKLLQEGKFADAGEIERFLREAESASKLDHPGIVPIHDIGAVEGQHYFTMQWLPGGALSRRLRDGPLPPRVAAELTRQIALAVQHAHAHGIIHRDLKPGNILLGGEEESTLSEPAASARDTKPRSLAHASGSDPGAVASWRSIQPKVADFGLARAGQSELTQSGEILGTPSYMPPEQARGQRGLVGPKSDVYGLGAILYCLLTGRPPYQAATPVETMLQVCEQEPAPPRQLNPGVPRDLETVCLKCLQKDPGRRYGSAADLAEDLRRWHDGEPILARRSGPIERTVRWARRQPVLASLLALVMLALAFSAWQWRSASRALARVEQALAQVEQEKRTRALGQIQALQTGNAGAVPALLPDLEAQRADVLPRLRELWHSEGLERGQRLRLALALIPLEPDAVHGELLDGLLSAGEPAEVLLARQALLPHKEELTEGLWSKAEAADTPEAVRLRALAALAAFDPGSPRWGKAGAGAVGEMLRANPLYLGGWVEALRPVRLALTAPLAEVFRGQKLPEYRAVAATVLADYAADNPGLLVELLLDADPKQYAILKPRVEAHREAALKRLRTELASSQAAAHQAQAGAALVHLGDAEAVWPLLRSSPDPTARTKWIAGVGALNLDPAVLVQRLEQEKDDGVRRALLLALGEFTGDQLPLALRQRLTPKLVQWYRDDPDPGVHAAVGWLLRHGQEGPTPRPLDWGQQAVLDKIDLELHSKEGKSPEGQRWWVNSQGQTLVRFAEPVEFRMGSPAEETGRQDHETFHHRRIGRGYALASTEVTVAQFQRFLKANPSVEFEHLKQYAPEPDCPQMVVTWYQAAQYCRWLSEQEGVPEDQMVYPSMAEIEKSKDGTSLKLPKDHLSRTGYRLPTEAEWEHACRAGVRAAWTFGGDAQELDRYSWYIRNSNDRTWPVSQKRPNDFGLFDLHGNALEWCQESGWDYKVDSNGSAEDAEDIRDITDRLNRILRGGSFFDQPLYTRSASRSLNRPGNRNDAIGFRIARTIAPGYIRGLR